MGAPGATLIAKVEGTHDRGERLALCRPHSGMGSIVTLTCCSRPSRTTVRQTALPTGAETDDLSGVGLNARFRLVEGDRDPEPDHAALVGSSTKRSSGCRGSCGSRRLRPGGVLRARPGGYSTRC
jgi:hypothetical protein